MGKRKATTKPVGRAAPAVSIDCVDVFCGVGGLTYGLRKAGVHVSAGIDLDPACRFPYEANNSARFVERSVTEMTGREIDALYSVKGLRLLAGCAPCQPFSTYSQGRDPKLNEDWGLLAHFGRLVGELGPNLVTMENVPQLANHEVFEDFVKSLQGYHVWHDVVDCADYGLPQKRRRLVLLASRLGPIQLIPSSHIAARRKTVRAVIGKMPSLAAGEFDANDPLHAAAGMSALNLRRIRASVPGGTWRDWPPSLRASCHVKASGDGYGAVYGRMRWNEPAPTMTTLCHGFGNGRFGHPEQDRGLSLREAAMLQTFPKRYKFVPEDERVRFTTVGRMIGNAVPPKLGEIIGLTLLQHVRVKRAQVSA